MNKKIVKMISAILALVMMFGIIPANVVSADDVYETFKFNIPLSAGVPIGVITGSCDSVNKKVSIGGCRFYDMSSGSPIQLIDGNAKLELGNSYRILIFGSGADSYDESKKIKLDVPGGSYQIEHNDQANEYNLGHMFDGWSADFRAVFEVTISTSCNILNVDIEKPCYFTTYNSINCEAHEGSKTVNTTCKAYCDTEWKDSFSVSTKDDIWFNIKTNEELIGDYANGDIILVNNKYISMNDSAGYGTEGYKINGTEIDIYVKIYSDWKDVSIPGLTELQEGDDASDLQELIDNAIGNDDFCKDVFESVTIMNLLEYSNGSSNDYKVSDFKTSEDLTNLQRKQYYLITTAQLKVNADTIGYKLNYPSGFKTIDSNRTGYEAVRPNNANELVILIPFGVKGVPRDAKVYSYYDGEKNEYAMTEGKESSNVTFKIDDIPIIPSWYLNGEWISSPFTFVKGEEYSVNLNTNFVETPLSCSVNDNQLTRTFNSNVGSNEYKYTDVSLTNLNNSWLNIDYTFTCEEDPNAIIPTGGGSKSYKAKDENKTAEKVSGSGKKGSTRTITPIEGKKVSSVVVKDKNGNKVDVTLNEDGTYSFIQPASEVTVEVSYKNREITLNIGSTEASIDGERETLDVSPVIRNDRTMLPIRFVAENLGAKVEWNEKKPDYVAITRGDTKIEITLGSDIMLVNGKEVKLDSVAFAENDRTYLPVRAISEALNAIVEWNEERPMEVKIYER